MRIRLAPVLLVAACGAQPTTSHTTPPDMTQPVIQDFTMPTPPDLTSSDICTCLPDGGRVDMADLAMPPDTAMPPDVAMPMPDMAVAADLAKPDFSTATTDLAGADLVTAPDLVVAPDMTCIASMCTSPPAGACADATHLYATTGTCGANGCTYGAGTACMYGCYMGVCNTTGAAFDNDATAAGANGATVTLTKTSSSSVGSGPANVAVIVTSHITPHGSAQSLVLTYTNNGWSNPTNGTPVTMSLTGTSGSDDVYTGTVPAQQSGTTVQFYLTLTPYGAAAVYEPGNFVNYQYKTQ